MIPRAEQFAARLATRMLIVSLVCSLLKLLFTAQHGTLPSEKREP
jgi:hypothetical protein